MNALVGALLLATVITFGSEKTRGLSLVGLGLLLWINPAFFAGLCILLGLAWYALS